MRPAALIAVLAALWGSRARANPIDAFGIGSRGIAMGGAQTALARDSSANYYNPAGLVAGRAMSIDVGYLFAQPWLRLNRRDLEVDQTRGITAGLTAPGSIGPFRFAFGVLLFLPDERVSRVRAVARDQPRFIYYDNRPQRIYLATNLAVQIIPGLYVGAGATFMSRTKGFVELTGKLSFPDPDVSSDMRLDLDVDLKALRYPQAGILWEPLGWLSVGVTYRHRFVLELEQIFNISGNVVSEDGRTIILPDGFFGIASYSTNLYQPRQVVIGLAARPSPRLTVSFDLTWSQWSDFINPGSRLQMETELGPFNDLVQLGSQPAPPDPGFRDTWSPRLGVEWVAFTGSFLHLNLRAGYVYEPSPAPEQRSRSMNLVDNHKHHVSFGLGLSLVGLLATPERPIDLDLHVAYLHLASRRHRKFDPVDPVGDYVSDGCLVSAGMTLRLRFQ